MHICQNKNIVEFEPETAAETAAMETLWRQLVSCTGTSGKLAPIGEFVPGRKNTACFVVESDSPGTGAVDAEQESVKSSAPYICSTCNRYMDLSEGDKVPLCCGEAMERME